MSEEKELQESEFEEDNELENFVDLADLGELESASTMEMFGGLGDIADLGDVPELSDNTPDNVPTAEVPVVNTEEVPDMEIPMPDISEEAPEIEIPMPDMVEEASEIDVSMSDMAEEASEIDVPMPDMAEEASEIDVPMPDMAEEVQDIDISMPDMEEVPNLDMSLSDMEEIPDLDMSLSDMEDLPDLDISDSAEEIDAVNLPDLGDISFDTVEPMQDALEAGEETAALTESDAELNMSDALEEPVLDDFDAFALEDAGAEESIADALDVLSESEEAPMAVGEDSDEAGIDSMLGGLLDNLDMNGSIDDSMATSDIPMEEDMMSDILGLDDNSFEEEGMEKLNASDDMLDVAGMIPDEEETSEKKPGFFKRVFGNIVTDEIAEEERQAAQQEEEEAAKKAEESAKAKEEAEAKKAEKKAEKEALKAERQKEKEAKKAEKAAKKAEKKAQQEEEAELEVVGKLNKVGVSIIAIATVLFLVVEIAGTNLFSYASTKKEALNYFEMGKYTEAYKEAVGTDMREKDEEAYNKIKVVMKVQQCLNAYQNYDRINYYPEALDALLRGIKRYDANIEQATELEVDKDMMSCRRQILTLLREEFGLSESEAYAIIALDEEGYQKRVIELGLKQR